MASQFRPRVLERPNGLACRKPVRRAVQGREHRLPVLDAVLRAVHRAALVEQEDERPAAEGVGPGELVPRERRIYSPASGAPLPEKDALLKRASNNYLQLAGRGHHASPPLGGWRGSFTTKLVPISAREHTSTFP